MSAADYARLYDDYWSRPDRWGSHSFADAEALVDRVLRLGIDRFTKSLGGDTSAQDTSSYDNALGLVDAMRRFNDAETSLRQDYVPTDDRKPLQVLDTWRS